MFRSFLAEERCARSFVLLVEYPHAAEPTPFVHWIVYDIPAGTISLREGLPIDLPGPQGAR